LAFALLDQAVEIAFSPAKGGDRARFGTPFYPHLLRRPHNRPASRNQGTRFHEPVGTGRGDGAEPEGDGVALWSETPGSGPSGRPEEAHAFPMMATVRGEMPDGAAAQATAKPLREGPGAAPSSLTIQMPDGKPGVARERNTLRNACP
jgi:hypothetical protein